MASAPRALFVPLSAAASRLLRSLSAVGVVVLERSPAARAGAARCYATRLSTYYLRGKMLHCGDQPAKLPVLLNGRDFEHWLVVMEPPAGDPRNPSVPRSEIITGYIKTLAQVVGSEEEARRLIYSVSTRYYFAFGASVSEELSCRIRELPNVKWVLPDSYLDPEEKDYGGEPFVNGEAVPYDCKYHLEWVQNDEYSKSIAEKNDDHHNDFEYYSELSSSESHSPVDSVVDTGALKQEITLKKNILPTDVMDRDNGADGSDKESGLSNDLDLHKKSTDQKPVSDDGVNASVMYHHQRPMTASEKMKIFDKVWNQKRQAFKKNSDKVPSEVEELESLQKERALQVEDKAESDEDAAADKDTESGGGGGGVPSEVEELESLQKERALQVEDKAESDEDAAADKDTESGGVP